MFPAARITKLREELNMTKAQLAKSVHVSSSSISEYERNTMSPSLPVLIELADYFDVSVDFLLGRTDNRISIKRLDEQLQTKFGNIRLDAVLDFNEDQRAIMAILVRSYMNGSRK